MIVGGALSRVVPGWGARLVLGAALFSADAGAEQCRPSTPLPPGAIVASWYGKEHHGRKTASGELFDERQLTAAHPWLKLRTVVLVTNLQNGRAVRVRITDRGPGYGRGIDLSQRAAELLGMERCGLAPVRLSVDPPGR